MGFTMPSIHQISHMVYLRLRTPPEREGLLIAHRTNIHYDNLKGDHIRYNRSDRMRDGSKFSSVLTHFQPVVAWIGLVGCLSIVLLFSSANMWNGKVTVEKILAAYVGVRDAFASLSTRLADCY